MPPTAIYKSFTPKAAESVRLSMPLRPLRESFQLLPQARLAFGADETRTLIARHRLFSVIFSLFVLAGVSPPASQKEKNPSKISLWRVRAVFTVRIFVITTKKPQ